MAKAYLMKNDGGSYETLCEITKFPDLDDPAQELSDNITLSDNMPTYMANFDATNLLELVAADNLIVNEKLASLKDEKNHYAIYFGDNGADGKYTFDGTLSIVPVISSDDHVAELLITIALTTKVTKA